MKSSISYGRNSATRLRASYEQMVMAEIESGVVGELGWSAESMKLQLSASGSRETHTPLEGLHLRELLRHGRLALRQRTRYSEMTLGRAERDIRRRWFREHVVDRPLSI